MTLFYPQSHNIRRSGWVVSPAFWCKKVNKCRLASPKMILILTEELDVWLLENASWLIQLPCDIFLRNELEKGPWAVYNPQNVSTRNILFFND